MSALRAALLSLGLGVCSRAPTAPREGPTNALPLAQSMPSPQALTRTVPERPGLVRRLSGSEEPPSERCESPHHGHPVQHELAPCAAEDVEAVLRWRPDALVVLGGGLLLDDEPSCATAQRARAAEQLFVALQREVDLVLSGQGPSRAPIHLDDAESECLRARLEVELESHDAPAFERSRARDELATVLGTDRATLTEADGMCAAILRRIPRAQWSATLRRVRFEPRSSDTVQNAVFSTPLLEQRRFARVLVLTTPVLHADGTVDNHALRALEDFRRARAQAQGRYRLAALGCPFVGGGPRWSLFE